MNLTLTLGKCVIIRMNAACDYIQSQDCGVLFCNKVWIVLKQNWNVQHRDN